MTSLTHIEAELEEETTMRKSVSRQRLLSIVVGAIFVIGLLMPIFGARTSSTIATSWDC